MMLDTTASEPLETNSDAHGSSATIAEKPSAPKSKPKPAKPKPLPNQGPIYLLLQENGKYKELRESELQAEASSVFRDPTLRLVKAQFLIPELSFKLADE